MRFLLSLFALGVLCFGQPSFAQDSTKVTSFFKWGVVTSADLNFQLPYQNNDFFDSDWRGYRFGHSLGLLLEFKLSKRIDIQTGINYWNFGEATKKRELLFAGPDPTIQSTHFKQEYVKFYGSVPLNLIIYFNKDNPKFFISPGLQFAVSRVEKQMLIFYNPKTRQQEYHTPNSSNIILFNTFSFGWDLDAGEHVKVRLAPTFHLQMNDLFTSRPGAAGLTIGIVSG